MTLLESFAVVADSSPGKLAEEFDAIHAKVDYGTSMRAALVEFNNEYHIPRLARTIKLITKAQEASNRITAVLSTAARASENQDDIERERRSRARMQIVIIVMTYLTLLGVMAILQVNFLDTMAGLAEQSSGGGTGSGAAGAAGGFGNGVDTDMLGMLFFHAVTLQAVISGLISGYMSEGSLLAGVKYAVVLPAFALIVFSVI
jgi:flagellar protein FlaJ